MYACMCVYMYVRMCVHVCVCICMYAFTYVHIGTSHAYLRIHTHKSPYIIVAIVYHCIYYYNYSYVILQICRLDSGSSYFPMVTEHILPVSHKDCPAIMKNQNNFTTLGMGLGNLCFLQPLNQTEPNNQNKETTCQQ